MHFFSVNEAYGIWTWFLRDTLYSIEKGKGEVVYFIKVEIIKLFVQGEMCSVRIHTWRSSSNRSETIDQAVLLF